MDGVPPVFVRESDILDNGSYPKVYDICVAVERSIGANSIAGAQRLGGNWRIYPTNNTARNNLLIKGFSFRNSTLKVCDVNPNILRDSITGEEKPSTKVWVDQVPLSVADSEILNALIKIGCEIRSDLKKQRARDQDGRLTRYLTGRRFVFITLPPKPLERKLMIINYNASIFHVEQEAVKKTVICSNCLQPGHHHSVCVNEVVCKVCRASGHKSGSPLCLLEESGARAEARAEPGERDERDAPREGQATSYAGAAAEDTQPTRKDSDTGGRGRDPVKRSGSQRQSTLDFRPRSNSVKRPASSNDNEESRQEKSLRLESELASTDHQPTDRESGDLC